MVSAKIFFIMSMGAYGPLCVSNFGMVGRFTQGTTLHCYILNKDDVGRSWCQKKIFKVVFPL